jgi:hypothetical protein
VVILVREVQERLGDCPWLMIFDKRVRQSLGIDDGGQSCRMATILPVLTIKVHKEIFVLRD